MESAGGGGMGRMSCVRSLIRSSPLGVGAGSGAGCVPGVEDRRARKQAGAFVSGAHGEVVDAGCGGEEEVGLARPGSALALPVLNAEPFQDDLFRQRQDPSREPGLECLVEPDLDFGSQRRIAPVFRVVPY